MSIPLDRLYNFLDSLSDHDLVIYRWNPHGSKKLEDLVPLMDYLTNNQMHSAIQPQMICHDQEPLDFAQYSESCILNTKIHQTAHCQPGTLQKRIKKYNIGAWLFTVNVYDRILLLHSEKNSSQLAQYQEKNLVPVYWWSHAIIARDWYRYAEHDVELATREPIYDFLIYNRAWSGTREYRLKFAELIVEHELHKSCKMGFSKFDNNINYQKHVFSNTDLSITSNNLENYFFNNQSGSDSSADYVANDYAHCGIEVILETLFDDTRWHLTEKTLRPIACGKPFILAATAGSLAYLRDYGFQTFDKFFDESYDQITDSTQRLQAIVNLMKSIAVMPDFEKQTMYQDMQQVCEFNKKRFFSKEFSQMITEEYQANLKTGIEVLKNSTQHSRFKETLIDIYKTGRTPWPLTISREELSLAWPHLRSLDQTRTLVPSQSASGGESL